MYENSNPDSLNGQKLLKKLQFYVVMNGDFLNKEILEILNAGAFFYISA